jgi:hypothetical protein
MINDQSGYTEVIQEICLHFDVPEHHLSLDDFISYAKNTRSIIDNFNKEVFSGKLEYKLLVLPPGPGSFLKKMGLVILGVPTLLLTDVVGDIGKGFIEGLL